MSNGTMWFTKCATLTYRIVSIINMTHQLKVRYYMLIVLRGHHHASLVRRARNRMQESASRRGECRPGGTLLHSIYSTLTLSHPGASSFPVESSILYADRVTRSLPCTSAKLWQYLMMFGECGNSLSPPAPLYGLYRLYTLYTPEISHFDLDSS